MINSLWPSDAIWSHTMLILVLVMACNLTAPSHYLIQYCLFISDAMWHMSIVMKTVKTRVPWYENWWFNITTLCPRRQWVKNFPWVIEQFYNGHDLLLKQLCASHDAMIKWRPYFIIIFSIFTQASQTCYGVFRCKGMGPKAQGHIHVYSWGLFRPQFNTQNSFSFHYIDVSNHRHLNRLLNCLFRRR